jgi:hypothetical protein
MPMLNAKGADNAVGGFADGDAQPPQLAIVPSGPSGQIAIQKRNDGIMAQCALDARGMSFVPSALKDLEQDEIAAQERLARGGGFQSECRWRCATAEVGNPDRAVDQGHDRPAWAALTHLVQIAL